MSALVRAFVPRTLSWLVPLVFAIACSDSDEIDFFEPGDDMLTGGSAGTTGGSDSGGSSNGGTTSTGGSEPSGGMAGTTGGSAGDSGGSQNQGGSDTGGMGGSMATGGTDEQGGNSGTAGDGGMATGGMGGGAGAAMGGAGAGGAGMGGAGMPTGGMAGAGMAGASSGGAAGAAGTSGCVPTMPSTERCDGVDNNCMGGVDEGMACPTNCTGATRAGHYYIFCSFENASGGSTGRERTWMQAMDFCQMRDTNLVFIESAEENAFILEWVTRMELEDQVWIGATDRDILLQNNEGEWVWGGANDAVQFWDGNENGDPVMDSYEDWASGEPNNDGNEDCGAMTSNHDYQWDDRNCSDTYMNFVCESGSPITTN